MNTNMPPFEDPSDARLHETMRDLPDHRAPDNLIPNVLAAIRAREDAASALARTPWYRRPATSWPPAMRIGLGAVALAIVALIAFAPHLLSLSGEGSMLHTTLTQTWEKLAALFGAFRALISACATTLRGATSSPLLLGGATVVLFSYFVLLGIGGAVWRTAAQTRQP